MKRLMSDIAFVEIYFLQYSVYIVIYVTEAN